jgi:pyrrolidone-carboxylate peptidase
MTGQVIGRRHHAVPRVAINVYNFAWDLRRKQGHARVDADVVVHHTDTCIESVEEG